MWDDVVWWGSDVWLFVLLLMILIYWLGKNLIWKYLKVYYSD